jgi:hypothetical protein
MFRGTLMRAAAFPVAMLCLAPPTAATAQEAGGVTMEMTSGSTSNTNTSQGNEQVINFSSAEQRKRTEFVSVPDVSAPSVVGGNPCVIGASFGASGLGFGVAAGVGVQDPECEMRQQVALLANIGLTDVAIARFCMEDEVREAFALSGRPCPQTVAAAPAAAPAPAAVAPRATPVAATATAPALSAPVVAGVAAAGATPLARAEDCPDYRRLVRGDTSFGEWPAACQALHMARTGG